MKGKTLLVTGPPNMAAAITPTLIGPYSGHDITAAAFTQHRSTEDIGHVYRAGTPQLTLHDFHKRQQSPLLPTSPKYEHRRVKRRPSVNILAESPANAPLLIRPLPPRDQLASILPSPHPHPQPPTTPQLKHTTTSPSLSSTVTTLQSTPTHTPIFRGGSSFERRRINQGGELVEPLRTKRKFQSLKRAKRLPHTVDGSGSGSGLGSSSGAEDDLWEVYAAVFDPPVEFEEKIELQTRGSIEHREGRGIEGGQARRAKGGEEGAHFATDEVRKGSGGQQTDFAEGSAKPAHSHHREEPAGTSSYSLSKFEFPVPPGHDNTFGMHPSLAAHNAKC